MKLVEAIHVPDHLTVEVWDKSQLIAANTTKVDLSIKMKFDIIPAYFDKIEHFEQVKEVFGAQISYEYRMGRSFVKSDEKEAVVGQLLESFKKNSLPYFSRQDFPRSFALAKYRDIGKNNHGYSLFPSKTSS
jgi:hypothetical protein